MIRSLVLTMVGFGLWSAPLEAASRGADVTGFFAHADGMTRCVIAFVTGDVESAFADWTEVRPFKSACADCSFSGSFQDESAGVWAEIVMRSPYNDERGTNFSCQTLDEVGNPWPSDPGRSELNAWLAREADATRLKLTNVRFRKPAFGEGLVVATARSPEGRLACLEVYEFNLGYPGFLTLFTSSPNPHSSGLEC